MFITFEGSEGSGKSTQVDALAGYLCGLGYTVLATREPGGTAIGDGIRAILSDLKNIEMEHVTEVLLFQASRAQLVAQVIRPHLAQKGIVLCDRYADSSLAYQGYGYGLDLDTLRAVINFATGGLKPDLTFFLDVDVEEGLRRRTRGGQINRLDTYQTEFYRQVRQGYLELIQAEPARWVIVDAGQPLEQVQAVIRRIVRERLSLPGSE